MATTVGSLMAEANAAVPRITRQEAESLIAEKKALVIDVRDAPELEKTGRIPGAHHISRGMLEFRADPAAPTFDKAFEGDRPVILYCASGGRSALAGKVLKDMGYREVYNLGGIGEWINAGGAVE